ncbi:MAG: DUF1461 domain-containing protein [Thermodesulfobacteriota bacterium]
MKKISLKESLLSFLFFVSFLYITFFVPMSFSIYNPGWFKFVCNFHDRCEKRGLEESHKAIDQLTGYFFHQNELDLKWTKKEKLHLKEVRVMFDKLVKTFLVMLLIFFITFNLKRLKRFSLINFFIILSFLVVIPFFKTFWRDIFHPLLFNNKLWLNNRFDFSYWIMPRKFFQITVGFIIISSALINFMASLASRNFLKRVSKN